MNAPDEIKSKLKEMKKDILKEGERVGGPKFINKLLSYTPIVINLEELQTQYNKAFWDKFTNEYEQKNYAMLYDLLEYLKNVYMTLAPSKKDHILEVIDVKFIWQRVEQDAYTEEELKLLTNNILDIVKSLHAPVYDEDLEKYREDINKGNLYFPVILKRIVELTRNILQTLEQFRSV